MLLMSVFGFAALFLAAIGVYGLMTYAVQQRTQETGIRMALGVQADSVLKMVIRQGMLFSLAGVVVGTASAYGLARSIASFLSEWSRAIPALRATRINPVTALRYE